MEQIPPEQSPLTQEQAEQIKQQLLKQLVNFPEDKREQIKQQVLSMSTQDVENFIKQNQLTHLQKGECIFCQIIQGKISSYKIDENKTNIAILEINPVTKGHTLIIPKEHLDAISDSAKQLANQTAEKIKSTLNPKDIKIQENKIMNHPIIEIIPIYNSNSEPSERKKADEEDLKKLKDELTKPAPTSQSIKVEEEPEPVPKLKPKIP